MPKKLATIISAVSCLGLASSVVYAGNPEIRRAAPVKVAPAEEKTYPVKVSEPVVTGLDDAKLENGKIVAEVTVKNGSKETWKGPVLFVVEFDGLGDISLETRDGLSKEESLQFIDLALEGKSIAPGKSVSRKLVFSADDSRQLTEEEFAAFKLEYQVIRLQKGESEVARKNREHQERVQQCERTQNKFTGTWLEAQRKGETWAKGVFGTGTGLDENGNPHIVAFTAHLGIDLPADFDGVPVKGTVTSPPHLSSFADVTVPDNPRLRFARPVPLGVSISNIRECTAGTIGLRVKDGAGVKYGLTCNHTIARLNDARRGEPVVQPGRVEQIINCAVFPGDAIGTVDKFYGLNYVYGGGIWTGSRPRSTGGTGNSNTKLPPFADTDIFIIPAQIGNATPTLLDAALFRLTGDTLSDTTPNGAYGKPAMKIAAPFVGLAVGKMGRSTSVTFPGTVALTNVAIQVSALPETGLGSSSTGLGRSTLFTGQFATRFLGVLPGDSGSVCVSIDGLNPVGMYFLSVQVFQIHNPMQNILSYFKVTVDSTSGAKNGRVGFGNSFVQIR